jgi:acetylornithine deacetylase/succinyl-diaminopimelate desuccinylase-like protein
MWNPRARQRLQHCAQLFFCRRAPEGDLVRKYRFQQLCLPYDKTPGSTEALWNNMMTSIRTALIASTSLLLTAGLATAGPPAPGPVSPPENQKLAHDIFQAIVEVNSVHDVGTRGVADILVRYFKAAGFTDDQMHVLAEEKYPNQVNVVVRLAGKGNGRPILWNGHIDVVDAKPEDWSLPPFHFTEKDGYFYGRGTSDMKDEDAAVAASLIRLKKEGFVPDRDIIVAFTADEEVSEEQDGMWYLVREHRPLVDAEMAINPDTGSGEIDDGKRLDFGVETSQKIYVTFTLETTNRGGHSSEPRPDNAINQLANGLVRLEHYQFAFKTNATTRLYFAKTALMQSGHMRADMQAVSAPEIDLAAAQRLAGEPSFNAILHSTCVATMLSGGHQENALPQRATATIQCRIMPDETVEGTRAAIEQAVADPGIKLSLLGTVVSAGESAPNPALMASVQQVAQSMWPGVPVIPKMAAVASDSVFTRQSGIPTYGIGGGWNDIHDNRMHGRDERHEIGDFYASVEFTYRLMKQLSQAR